MSCLSRHPSALEVGARRVSWFLELLNHKENQVEIVGESIVIKIAIYCWVVIIGSRAVLKTVGPEMGFRVRVPDPALRHWVGPW